MNDIHTDKRGSSKNKNDTSSTNRKKMPTGQQKLHRKLHNFKAY